ncbi:hypothetical protein Clacol_007033 [Clathrus columnatus]|uniref:F-box domain-containing protein n=1 Tax=Clathrus columnatus TaxID=1419009 RepID=A0AAV5AI55_9AGAM|nr:hypothetical protein Clacol_007033 [Clathrus columnatus]
MTYPKGLSIHTIWDEIAYLLDLSKDLLSLALTCRTFKDLIIPDHIEYRHIRCHIRREDVWKHLESRPRLTRGVRFLHLHNGYSTVRLPEILEPRHKVSETKQNGLYWDTKITKENFDMFRSSLSHMTLLKEFGWNQGYICAEEIIDIIPVLTNTTHCLEALSMRWTNEHYGKRRRFETLPIWGLSGLKRVILQHSCTASMDQMILNFCPDIEDLCLVAASPDSINNIMRHANWGRLRRLSIWETFFFNVQPISSTVITSFFDRHTNLESLVIPDMAKGMPTLPSSCLPKLRSIRVHVHLDSPLGDDDADNLPQLDKLETFTFQIHETAAGPCPSILLNAPNLKKIHLVLTDYLDDLVSADHNVSNQKENTNMFPSPFFDLIKRMQEMQEEMTEVFLQCPNLTHIYCEAGSDSDKFCEGLSALRDLKISELNSEGGETCVGLERDESWIYSEYQCVPLTFKAEAEAERREVESWGNFFSYLSDIW